MGNHEQKHFSLEAVQAAMGQDKLKEEGKIQKYTCALKNVMHKSGYKDTSDLGKITITMELVPKTQSDKNPVGLGRKNPNHSPWCPPPIGRI